MSDTTVATTPASVAKDSFICKVEKHIEQYRAKIQKLQEENQKLKAQNAQLKSANSRVRRIPKQEKAEGETTTTA